MKELIIGIPFVQWLIYCVCFFRTKLTNWGKRIKIQRGVMILNTKFADYNSLYKNVRIYDSSLDKFVYINESSVIHNTNIGRFCSIGPGCRIGLGIHPSELISTFPAFFSTNKQCHISFADKTEFIESLPVTIGNDVWIGANVIIVDGVTIGNGAIIATGAVVNKDVEPYTIVGGVPAKPLKKRFDDEKIAQLQTLQWWNKDIQWLQQNWKLFNNPQQFFSLLNNNDAPFK